MICQNSNAPLLPNNIHCTFQAVYSSQFTVQTCVQFPIYLSIYCLKLGAFFIFILFLFLEKWVNGPKSQKKKKNLKKKIHGSNFDLPK
jgi:hypothetical protein